MGRSFTLQTNQEGSSIDINQEAQGQQKIKFDQEEETINQD
jgi:hypothetical protein